MFELDTQLRADTVTLGDLPLCQVLLMNDSNYPWIILVPRSSQKVREIIDLSNSDQLQLHQESIFVSKLIMSHFAAYKLNTATLGNQVAQLHVHHIARFPTDPAWPHPVWGRIPAKPYDIQNLKLLMLELQRLLSSGRHEFLKC